MKRILLILSILMITGVSAQIHINPKVTNLTVKTNTGNGGDKVMISWDVKRAKHSLWTRNTGIDIPSHKWKKAKVKKGVETFGIALHQKNVFDRTYDIAAVNRGQVHKRRVRVVKIINGKDIDGNLELELHGVLSPTLIGKKVYLESTKGFTIVSITTSNNKSTVLLSKPLGNVNIAEYLAILINRPGSKVNYIWYKKTI